MSDIIQDIINLDEYIKDKVHKESLDRITDRLEEALGMNHQLRAKLTLMHQASDERDEAIIKEVALDCALMAENDYSAADVAVEIREKYGLERIDSDRFCLKEVDDE